MLMREKTMKRSNKGRYQYNQITGKQSVKTNDTN